MVNTVIRLC